MRNFLKRYPLPLLLLSFILLTAGYAFLTKNEEQEKDKSIKGIDVQNRTNSSVFTVGSESRLIYQITYSKCDHTEVLRERLPEDEVGLTVPELRTIYQEWDVEQAGSDVFLTATVDGLCEHCRNSIFVGVYQDNIAIFYGEPGGNSWLKEITDSKIDSLPPQEQEDLWKGVIVSSEEELLHILEGLMN